MPKIVVIVLHLHESNGWVPPPYGTAIAGAAKLEVVRSGRGAANRAIGHRELLQSCCWGGVLGNTDPQT